MKARASQPLMMPFIFLLFAVVFGGAAVGMFFGLIVPEWRMQSIAKNGYEREAIVEGMHSNLEVNGQPYYHIVFRWEDNNGVWRTNKSSPSYTRWQAEQIVNQGTVTIKTRGTRAVLMPYVKSPNMSFLPWLLLPFFGVGVGMGTAFGVSIVRVFRNKSIARRGTESVGVYIDHGVGYYMNNDPMHFIRFHFTDSQGAQHEVKTASNYRSFDAQELRREKEFPIKYRGKRAVIMRNWKAAPPARNTGKQNAPTQPEQQGVRCDYCGLFNGPRSNRCSACGAKLFLGK
jgi:DNA-directed RNA polymerase subunit RPC12/RpoP